jgi:hypothetical protein
MRHQVLLATFCATASALAQGTASKGSEWHKVSDDDGIIVYQKKVEGLDTVSLRGETTIAASIKHITDLMADNSIAHLWMPMVAERRTLKMLSPMSRVEYTHVAMPWPITDRYFVNIGQAETQPDGSMKLSVKSHERPQDFMPLQPDKVLGILHFSEFLLTKLEGGRKTRIQLEVNTDPKGNIPSWIVNVAQRSWPRDFFTGLIGQLRKRGQIEDTIGPASSKSIAH